MVKINLVYISPLTKMINQILQERSANCCELCKAAVDLTVYLVPPDNHATNQVVVCNTCLAQLEKSGEVDSKYWRFLTETMWSNVPAVQVIAWRILSRLNLNNETWASDNLDMLYLDEETLVWAKLDNGSNGQLQAEEVHTNSLGSTLNNGDTVVLTKSLDVKGSSLNAKMGTVVKNIRLVANNTDQVEGKIDGQLIVILTKYLRKQKS
jgi:protein PhnA